MAKFVIVLELSDVIRFINLYIFGPSQNTRSIFLRLRELYKQHSMTKWYSSSRQLLILHNLSLTGLCGRAHQPASISNLWDETRSLANEIRNFNTLKEFRYALGLKSAIFM